MQARPSMLLHMAHFDKTGSGKCCTKCCRIAAVVLVLLLFLLPAATMAQDKQYIYQDSSVLEPIADTQREETSTVVEESETEQVRPDSVLVSNELSISADSVKALKSTKPFAYSKNLDSLLKSLKKEQEVNYTVDSNAPSAIDLFFSSAATKAVLWTIAVGMLLFILFKLFISGGVFQRSSTKSRVEVVAGEEAVPGINEYSKLISQALAQKDYRLATRYLYLQSLHFLIDKGVVTYAVDKTNYEYLAEMGGNPKREAFAALTLKYDYVWYGGFTIDEAAFAGIQQSFTQFNNTL